MKKVKIIEENCIACGLCESIAGDIFVVEDVARVIVDKVKEDQIELVQEAIDSCPTDAIEWDE
ncbi:MAG: ferredoxin [Bacilli bacterium]|nr:ferredoxin [Bacilli bacterium]MDD4283061.1 ferredoxin [Bacilli bacterium]MDD4718780.1 ferredoxin [Bacilli bacterium]